MPIIHFSGPIDKAISVTKAVVEHVNSGMPLLTLEEKNERLKICYECEYFDHNWCKKCGCNLQFKTLMPLQECPIKKWGIHPKAQKIISEITEDSKVKIGECQGCTQPKIEG